MKKCKSAWRTIRLSLDMDHDNGAQNVPTRKQFRCGTNDCNVVENINNDDFKQNAVMEEIISIKDVITEQEAISDEECTKCDANTRNRFKDNTLDKPDFKKQITCDIQPVLDEYPQNDKVDKVDQYLKNDKVDIISAN